MAQNTLKTRIKHACKTENEWSNSNPVLLLGELAFSPGGKYKIGDGTSTWSELSYVIPTKADIGLGNVENKSSATIRGELTKANVTKALGYTPPTTNTTYGVATSSTLGLVKSGTDITVDSSGNVSINDDSHNHIISNIDGLQSALDAKKPSEPTTFSLQTNYVGVRTANRTASQYYEFWDSVGWADIQAGSFTTHGNFIGNLSGNADSASSVPWSGITGKPSTFTPSDHTHDSRYYTESEIDTKLNTKLNTSLKGAASGLAELDSTGRVPSSQLPSYVDDVIEGYLYDSKFYKESAHTTQITGETGKIYVDLTSNKTYRWSGSAFAVISETLALGETSTTAYRGDRGKIAYDHSQVAHAPSNAEVNQNAFSNVTVGSTTIAADSKTDTLTLVAGSNVTLTPDATNDKITISSTNTDTKVTQTAISSADYTNWRSLIWGASNSGTEGFTPSTVTDGVYTCNTLSVQPSSGTIRANVFKGDLSGNVTGNVSGSSGSCTGNASTSTKLQTARSIALGTAVTSTATNFDGSANITIPVTGVKEAYLKWGGGNFSGSYGCIDAAMIPDLGANRLAFGKASGITVEYSRDGGSTWTDYGATDSQKAGLLGTGSGLRIGKADSNNKATADYKLRITLDTDKIPVYTALNKFAIYVSTEGSTGSYCTIEASLESTPSTFVTFADRVAISGWSGWNIINTSGITTYGNSASNQYGLIRFTFGCTGGSTTYNGLNIIRIMGFGGVGWTTPSNMAKYGTIYAYNSDQEVSFPAKVAAPSFSGTLSGNATTATTLQNARTINGTSFNGSANITTANWGTARNIYITDADGTNTGDGVSVNGAGNATLKLPSTIKATLSGNASTATTLANARTIQTNLGSTSSASFNGGANITPGVTGTLPVANGGTGATTLTSGAALIGNGTGAISTRSITNMTTKSYIDYNTNLMTTNTLAYWNGAYASNNASNLTYCNKGAFGDAAVKGVDTTATSGSTNLITSGAMYTALSGKAASNHTHSYLPLSGGTLTGRLSADGKITLPSSAGAWISGMTLSNASIQVSTQQTTSSYHPYFAVKTNGNHVVNIGGLGDSFGFYGFKSGRTENATDWSFTFDVSSGSISSTHTITAPTFSGALSGNASTATKLATARTIALTGSVTGSGTFDGSGNLSIATTTNHTHNYAGSSSAGGSANSAVKLDSNAGSATQPIYFSGGKPTACSYTLSKSVPSDAKFTDTTYSTGTESTSGLTKLYTVIGTAIDGTMTQNAITTELNKKSKVTIVRWS